jgi:hypothetical protein
MKSTNPFSSTIPALDLVPIDRLTRDLTKASHLLSDDEARFLVSMYYKAQDDRKRGRSQERELQDRQAPNLVISWFANQSEQFESQIQKALDAYTKAHPMGAWMRSITGIGPVLSAGLLAHIKIERAPTVGHIWSFAGLDPNSKWEKGQRRPWNAELKTLCWKIGDSFMKQSFRDNCYYGKLYLDRKAYEQAKNEAGDYSEQAARLVTRVGKDTEAFKHYSAGKLPPAQILARSQRWAVKIFLSHMHAEWYRKHFNQEPPKPFAIAILGHAHLIPPMTSIEANE